MRIRYRYARRVVRIASTGRITPLQGQYIARKSVKRAHKKLRSSSRTTTQGRAQNRVARAAEDRAARSRARLAHRERTRYRRPFDKPKEVDRWTREILENR